MAKLSARDVFKCTSFIIIFNILFTFVLILWVTDDDLTNLPELPIDRFISLFYFLITTFTTTGYGDIHAKSNKMKIIVSLYMILTFSVTASFLIDF
jgi:hypothetical protein